jgi:hypothetical protein
MDSTGCTAKQELHMATKYDEADSDGLDDLNLLTEAALAKKIRMTPGAVRNARMRGSLGIPFIKLGRGKRARIHYPRRLSTRPSMSARSSTPVKRRVPKPRRACRHADPCSSRFFCPAPAGRLAVNVGFPVRRCVMADDILVQDFVDEPDVFFLGIKSLNAKPKSVAAAKGKKEKVIPVVARHLYREIRAETCWAGGRINPAKSAMNYSLLHDGPTTAAGMTTAALDAMAEHDVPWQAQRKDQIMGVELVISVSPSFKGDLHAFFRQSLEWTQRHLINAVHEC